MDLVALGKAAILGLVEGLTEFIPVSSTGHLIVVQQWLSLAGKKENAFAIFIQLGAILAVVWHYRAKLLELALSWPRDGRARLLLLNLIVGTIPAIVIGLPTDDWVEAHFFRPFPVALAFVLGGIAILVIERICRRARVKSIDEIPLRLALGVGLIQVLAILFPGVSRSGATIMGGLALGLSRGVATEFSFFLAIPALVGASALKLIGVRDQISSSDAPVFAMGFIVAFISALFVVRALIGYVSKKDFTPFAWYRIAFGILLIVLYWNSRGGF